MSHSVTIDFEGMYPHPSSFHCSAPDDAMCRAVWDCDCESWEYEGIAGGVPWHGFTDSYLVADSVRTTVTRHRGRFDPNHCNIIDWLANSDETGRGTITLPIKPEWQGDYYTWTVATP